MDKNSTEGFNIARNIEHWFDTLSFSFSKERTYFVENLSMLIGSGMTVTESLSAIERELDSKHATRLISSIRTDIENGYTLSKALGRSGVFKGRIITLIHIGEQSGRLAENLRVVAEQSEKERELRSKIRSALMYPLFVLGLTFTVGIGIAWFILPRLSSVFAQLNVELPKITQILIGFGSFLGEHGTLVIPAFLLFFGVLLYFVFGYSRTRFIGQAILFAFPPVRRLIQEVEIARFGYLLGTLLDAGLPIVLASGSLVEGTEFRMYRKFYETLQRQVDEGHSFRNIFDSYPGVGQLIPIPIQQLIVSAEHSGRLSETLKIVGERYEKKIDLSTKSLTVLLEPVLLVIVWLGVVAVAIAVILPIYSLTSGVQSPSTSSPQPAPTVPVTIPATSSTLELQANPERFEVVDTVEYLNVRSEPTATSSIVGRLFPGDQRIVAEEQIDWVRFEIEPGGELGWVFKDYVDFLDEE